MSEVHDVPGPGFVRQVAAGQRLQAAEQRGVQAVAIPAGFDRLGQPGRPGRPVQIACASLQLDRGKHAGEHRGEQLRLGRQARSPVQDLAEQPPLDREDGAA
jgi:hypothetical protein